MAITPQLLSIDPAGMTVTVDISDTSGTSITAYTTSGGATAHTLPISISAKTDFWLTTGGRYTISAKVGTTEIAGDTVEVGSGIPLVYVVSLSGAETVTAFEPGSQAITAKTDDYTLTAGDAHAIVTMNKASANTLTVPPNASVAFPIGTVVTVVSIGAGQTTIAAGAGVTVSKAAATLKMTTQYSVATLTKIAANTWIASGDLAAS